MSTASGVAEAVEEILARGGDADDALRQVVAVLHERGGYAWVGLFFVEEGSLTPGPEAGTPEAGTAEAGTPEAGTPDAASRIRVPVIWQGAEIAQLAVDGASPADTASLERVAVLVSGHCLVGWDTGGERWDP
jgi:putative methionine-R-sulfoxide reductase with GAF domain